MTIAGPTTDHEEIRIWAEKHHAIPTEILSRYLDHEPMTLRMMFPEMAGDRQDIRVLTWEEFFTKFDMLGLTFVYDHNSSGYNELLQIDSKNPYRSSRNQPIDPHN